MCMYVCIYIYTPYLSIYLSIYRHVSALLSSDVYLSIPTNMLTYYMLTYMRA